MLIQPIPISLVGPKKEIKVRLFTITIVKKVSLCEIASFLEKNKKLILIAIFSVLVIEAGIDTIIEILRGPESISL